MGSLAVALFLVWLGWGRELHPVRALLFLIAFGSFPGAVYNCALFPTSLALAGVVGALLAATRERFLLAAVLMTLSGLLLIRRRGSQPAAWPSRSPSR